MFRIGQHAQSFLMYLFALCAFTQNATVSAQFIDVTEMLGVNNVPQFSPHGHGVSFYDFNKDGWDDLTLSAGYANPLFFVNNNGVLEPADFTIPNMPAGNISMMLWADYDNDGDADLLIAKFGGGLELWNNDGDFNFTEVGAEAGLQMGNFEHVGAAFCDYDHDGYLDLYVTKFYHPSFWPGPNYAGKLYKNNGDGTFTDATVEAGVYIPARPMFQPVFLDFDGDGWEDLFLVIDRVFWPNELFRNNGDGTFTQVTEESGFDFNICAMTGTVDDFDNDGDLDIYITNNPPVGNKLMQNNGDGTFSDIAGPAGVHLIEVSWGSLWLDYNNNSWQDLFVGVTSPVQAPVGNQFYVNNAGLDFTQQNEMLGIADDPSETYVCARGDFNNDGYFDFAINNKPPHPSRLYMNVGGENNYLAVTLQGTISNKDGIGTWIHCYAEGEHYVRFTLCGENLISQNSGKEIFGLGNFSVVDSLVLEWNMGTRDVYYNLDVNQHLQLIEGASLIGGFNLSVEGNTMLCPNDTIILDAGEHETYLWNTGWDGQFLAVSDTGTYHVTVTNSMGASGVSNPIQIGFAPTPEVNWFVDDITCYGENNGSILVEISTSPLQSFVWNTGQFIQFIDNLPPGEYTFTATDSYGCQIIDSATVIEPDSIVVHSEVKDVSCFGAFDGHVTAAASGGHPPYFYNWMGMNPNMLAPGEYSLTITDWSNCNTIHHFSIGEPDSLHVSLVTTQEEAGGSAGTAALNILGGTSPYNIVWSHGPVDVYSVDELPAGAYSVIIIDANGCSTQLEFIIDLVSSIGENNDVSVRIFPNPFNDYVLITDCASGIFQIEVFNSTGQHIRSVENFRCGDQLNLSGLQSGLAILFLTDLKGNRTAHKLVKSSGH